MASSQHVSIEKPANTSPHTRSHQFQDSFLIVATMNFVILVNPFVSKRILLPSIRNKNLQFDQIGRFYFYLTRKKAVMNKKNAESPLQMTKKVNILP